MSDKPITLADVRGLIQERIGAYRVLSRFAAIDQNAANACINVLTEVLAMLDRVSKDPCPGCGKELQHGCTYDSMPAYERIYCDCGYETTRQLP